jgi:hypothetical protein
VGLKSPNIFRFVLFGGYKNNFESCVIIRKSSICIISDTTGSFWVQSLQTGSRNELENVVKICKICYFTVVYLSRLVYSRQRTLAYMSLNNIEAKNLVPYGFRNQNNSNSCLFSKKNSIARLLLGNMIQ